MNWNAPEPSGHASTTTLLPVRRPWHGAVGSASVALEHNGPNPLQPPALESLCSGSPVATCTTPESSQNSRSDAGHASETRRDDRHAWSSTGAAPVVQHWLHANGAAHALDCRTGVSHRAAQVHTLGWSTSSTFRSQSL